MNTAEPTAEELAVVGKYLDEAMGNKKVRRNARKRLARDLAREMEQGVLGRRGLRPSQIRAAAKQKARNESSAALRAWKERSK